MPTYEVFLTSTGRTIKVTQSLSVARILGNRPGYDYAPAGEGYPLSHYSETGAYVGAPTKG